MNYKTLKDDFMIRFNTDHSVDCVFCGTPLFLLGDITPGYALVTSLSAGTALAYAPRDKPLFSVQSSDSNISYTSPAEKLLQYHEENYAKDCFHLLAHLLPDLPLKGADFLFSNNCTSSLFHNQSAAICMLFSSIFSISPQEIITKIPFSVNDVQKRISLISSMCVTARHAEVYDNFVKNRYPLPISGHKTIIITADIKKSHLRKNVSDAVKTLQSASEQNLDFCDITREMLINIPNQQKQILDFCINERQRISYYSKVSSLHDLCELVNASSRELLNIINSKELTQLYNISSSAEGICALRPTFDGSALYCIVTDNSVDKFIFQTEAAYEKKAGFKPAFYVCDTVTNGIIH